jgi:hypothetical protein
MGLDLVELIIRVEETFGLPIPDRVATGLNTPGKVTDFILSQVEESEAPLSCLSQKAFYSLRREFIQQLSLSRRQFVPDVKLKEILPEDRKDEVWKSIGSSLGVKRWPALSRTWLGFFTPTVQSVRELTDYFVTNEPLIVKGKETAWSRKQIWDVLERVIRDETGVTDFSEDSRFIEDMHLD